MAQRTREALKALFETDDAPNQQDFIDLIDTFFSMSENNLDNVSDGVTNKKVTATEKTSYADKYTVSQIDEMVNTFSKVDVEGDAPSRTPSMFGGGVVVDVTINQNFTLIVDEVRNGIGFLIVRQSDEGLGENTFTLDLATNTSINELKNTSTSLAISTGNGATTLFKFLLDESSNELIYLSVINDVEEVV